MLKTDKEKWKNTADAQIEMRICANPDYLCVVRRAVRQVAETLGMKEEDAESVILAVVEAVTNVIRHSYGGPCEKPIIVSLNKGSCGDENRPALEIVIRDFGKQVDPKTIKGRDLEDIRPGGLGIHIIQSIMDEIEFKPMEDCGMRLRMAKCIEEGPRDIN